jgi:hypothetical protein
MDIIGMGWSGIDWNNMSQERDQWRAVVNTIMSFVFHEMLENTGVAKRMAPLLKKDSPPEINWLRIILICLEMLKICKSTKQR